MNLGLLLYLALHNIIITSSSANEGNIVIDLVYCIVHQTQPLSFIIIAIIELEQSGVLYACHGGAMTVTCSTSAELLRWNITLLHSDSFNNQRIFVRDLSYIGTAIMATPISTALTILNISRSLNTSSPLPLISTIFTNNTTTDLNGTVMTCSGTPLRSSEVYSVEVILIGNNTGNINSRF